MKLKKKHIKQEFFVDIDVKQYYIYQYVFIALITLSDLQMLYIWSTFSIELVDPKVM